MDKERIHANRLEWYVMRCRRPEQVVNAIRKYSQQAGELDQIADQFIPADSFRKGKDIHPEEAHMGSTLRRFVFLRIRPSGLKGLMQQDFQLDPDRRLYYYRDYHGDEQTVGDAMMQRFIMACVEYGAKFEIFSRPGNVERVTEGLTVKVREGAFKGLDAEVTQVQHTSKGIRFSMAVKLFGNNYAYIHDCQEHDVIISGGDEMFFNLRFIDEMDLFLQDTFHRYVKSHELSEDDREQMRCYYRLCNATFDDEYVRDRFNALMSICASLLRNTSGKTRYNKLLKTRIKDLRQQESTHASKSSLAWLLTALFISTRDADYRTTLKTLVPTIIPRNDSISRFLALLRQL